MKFSCNQAQLAKALNIVSKAVSSRTTLPVLKSILMETTEDGKLILSATDLDLSITKTIDVSVEEVGSVAVGARLFLDIIRKLPNETLSIDGEGDNKVFIKALNSEFYLNAQSADEFPAIPGVEEEAKELVIDANIYTDMVRKTGFSASTDETKGIIVGTLLEIEPDAFTMVALDGFRMAISKEKIESDMSRSVVVSARILNEVNKIIQESNIEDNLKLYFGEKRAALITEDTAVHMRLMEGDFIKYKDILPKECKTTVRVAKRALVEAVERASLLAREGRNNLITCSVTNNLLQITSHSEEGDVKEDIIIETKGEGLEIGFNSKYMLDALKVIEDEDVMLEFNTPITPCLIKPTLGERFEYLILPVRIPSR